MFSKRQLYRPAPKQNVGQKKVRKLIQGKLEPVSTSFSSQDHPHTSVSGPASGSDARIDPTLSPRRSIPSVTEYASPRAEPPSSCLDLSDTETNLSMASSTSTARQQQPIMVCDASHLASSSDSTEVDVVVNYQESPAKIICHTPSRLDKSLQSGFVPSSPRPGSVDMGPATVRIDSPRTLGSTSSRNLFHKETNNMEEKGRGSGLFLSQHSRGIIKEILAEEIGHRDIDSISLTSQQSPPSHVLPLSSSPLDISRNNSSITSSPGLSQRSAPKNPGKNLSSPNPKDVSNTEAYLKLNLNFDSDVPQHSEGSQAKKKDKVDRAPKIEAAKSLAISRSQTESDSDACSLYEYVPQKKKDARNEDRKNPSDTNSQSHRPSSAKKKLGRVVSSRFMNVTPITANQSSLSSEKSLSKSSNTSKTSHVSHKIKPNLMPNRSLKPSKSSSTCKLLSVTGKNFSSNVVAAPPPKPSYQEKSKKDQLTSTPTHDRSCHPCEIDASSIHINMSSTMASMDNNSSEPDMTLKRDNTAAKKSKAPSDQASLERQQLEVDMQYTRYLQALFMVNEANKSFMDQEKQAMKQINGLWMLREKKCGELAKTKMEVERLKSLVQVDDALEKTEAQLKSLEEKMPQVMQDYSTLCGALNNTRHQIVTKDIHIPNKTEEEREEYEDKLDSTLRESERLLSMIAAKTGSAAPSLHQYVSSLEAISGNVAEGKDELCEGHKGLEVAQGLCSQLSSRMVLSMQNSSL